jgi:hypothetical protein
MLLLCFFLGSAWICAAMAEEAPLSMVVSGELVIDRDGSVHDFSIANANLAPDIRKLVEQAGRRWRFAPVVRGGAPVLARTGYSMRLLALPAEGGYRMKIEDLDFVTPRKILSQPIPMSGEIMTARQDVDLLAAIRVDQAGNVIDAEVMAVQGRTGAGVRNRRIYEQVVKQTLRRWKFEPARPDLGDTKELSGMVSFSFLFSPKNDSMAGWRQPEWKDVKQVPWLRDPDTSDLSSGTLVARTEGVRLATPVVGTTL